MASWLRALLRRLGIGERRWIPPPDERNAHAELVRDRLPKATTKDQEPPSPE
jgi:hypothetical protein